MPSFGFMAILSSQSQRVVCLTAADFRYLDIEQTAFFHVPKKGAITDNWLS